METGGFKFNPYYSCVDNKIIEGDPLILAFHVYDVKASNSYTKLVDIFEQWIGFMYGDTNIVRVKLVRQKVHEYFPMTLYYTRKREVKTDMRKYVKKMIDEFTLNNKKYRQ